ncbi:MAG: helix-turn-helix domain-containing protein [Lachnospiraceae bacterium]|nr:helix-turn-helix domain-containing protein [Lachnospiraceae bacterium]
MARVSAKEDKSIYQVRREELGLSREKASELLVTIPPEKIERIENEKILPRPEDILTMAEGYKMPSLCNYYCANECPIGKQYVPEIKVKDLSQIVLEMLASLNTMQRKQERLIEITADGKIEENEIRDFIHIQEELERISITVETMQLWVEKMLAENVINMDVYREYKDKTKQ